MQIEMHTQRDIKTERGEGEILKTQKIRKLLINIT